MTMSNEQQGKTGVNYTTEWEEKCTSSYKVKINTDLQFYDSDQPGKGYICCSCLSVSILSKC